MQATKPKSLLYIARLCSVNPAFVTKQWQHQISLPSLPLPSTNLNSLFLLPLSTIQPPTLVFSTTKLFSQTQTPKPHFLILTTTKHFHAPITTLTTHSHSQTSPLMMTTTKSLVKNVALLVSTAIQKPLVSATSLSMHFNTVVKKVLVSLPSTITKSFKPLPALASFPKFSTTQNSVNYLEP